MRRRYILALLVILLAACRQEATMPDLENPRTPTFGIAEADPWAIQTRSLLTAKDVETKKTEITLAAYADGSLVAAGHFTEGLDAMTLELEPDKAHSIYALVNMGNQTASIPRLESELADLTYTIPSYTEGAESLASRGLPMAGKLNYPGQGTVIPVERLLAKVTAHLSCDWDGAAIQSVRVCNLNQELHPFGVAAKEGSWTQQEFHEGTKTASGTFVFYVPENRQGTIGGIGTSADKSPDRNSAVKAKQDKLTYLEAKVTSTASAYAGEITYRSYLGGNATTDFDIERNALYDWTLVYHADRTQEQDWKRDGDVFRVVVTADRTEAFVGETVHLTAKRHRSNHGTVSDVDVTADVTWTKNAGGSSALTLSSGAVMATAPGAASFLATCTLDGRTAYGDSPVITFKELPPLVASWTDQAVYVGQRGRIAISGLADGATITSVTSTDECIAAKAAVQGRDVYVNYLGAGSATLTVTASNGQTGTFEASPVAPHLLDMNGVGTPYYGHPDGTDVNTDRSGHDGLPPSFGYYTGTTVGVSTRMSVGTNPSQTATYVGRTLAPDLYDSMLRPVLAVNNPARFGVEGTSRIWVQSLVDYPTSGGVSIGTFTVSPANTACGVAPLTGTIRSVDPFAGMGAATTWPDFDDKGMLEKYVDCDSYEQNIQVPGAGQVNAAASSVGWDVKLAGSWNATMKALFTGNDNYLYFKYVEGDALPHVGGLCEVQRTVTNRSSGEKIGKTFLSFRVIVWGAVGGKVHIDNSSRFEVRPAYVGPAAARPTGNVFRTSYADGEAVTIYGQNGHGVLNGTVHRDDTGHGLGQAAYSVTLSGGDVLYDAQVFRSINPCLTWSGSSDTYYRVVLLEDVQTKIVHSDYHLGWVLDSGGTGPSEPPVD